LGRTTRAVRAHARADSHGLRGHQRLSARRVGPSFWRPQSCPYARARRAPAAPVANEPGSEALEAHARSFPPPQAARPPQAGALPLACPCMPTEVLPPSPGVCAPAPRAPTRSLTCLFMGTPLVGYTAIGRQSHTEFGFSMNRSGTWLPHSFTKRTLLRVGSFNFASLSETVSDRLRPCRVSGRAFPLFRGVPEARHPQKRLNLPRATRRRTIASRQTHSLRLGRRRKQGERRPRIGRRESSSAAATPFHVSAGAEKETARSTGPAAAARARPKTGSSGVTSSEQRRAPALSRPHIRVPVCEPRRRTLDHSALRRPGRSQVTHREAHLEP